MKHLLLFITIATLFSSKLSGQITQQQIDVFLNDTAIRSGHVGISIYEPATNKYLYTHNAEKNFLPSSNVKLFSMYAGMKYLGDSLVGLRYYKKDNTIVIIPTGDPTLLHSDFTNQKVFDFLKLQKNILLSENMIDDIWRENRYGNGWSWNDYNEDYMTERSCFPIYKNMINVELKDKIFNMKIDNTNYSQNNLFVIPSFLKSQIKNPDTLPNKNNFSIERELGRTTFNIIPANSKFTKQEIPFQTSSHTALALLMDTITRIDSTQIANFKFGYFNTVKKEIPKVFTIHSQPTDSLLRPMMHNSDNFFAEQTLLMVSNEVLGYMSDEAIIDTLLKTDLKDLPQKPRWVDGSGLSRYNLFSPNDFIYLLQKMQAEFGMRRIKNILPTAGQGTLRGYYENAIGKIYAKTGSMSNNVSLSGYITTKKNKALLFSVHINGFSGTGRAGRKAIEKMIMEIIENN